MRKRFIFFAAAMLMALSSFAEPIKIDFKDNVRWQSDLATKTWKIEFGNADYTLQLSVTPKGDNPFGTYLKKDFDLGNCYFSADNPYEYLNIADIGAMISYDIAKNELTATISVTDDKSREYEITASRTIPTGSLGTKKLENSDLAIYKNPDGFCEYNAVIPMGNHLELRGKGDKKTGTFTVGSTAQVRYWPGEELWFVSGSFTVTEVEGDYVVTGSLVGFDNYTYTLDLKKYKSAIPDFETIKDAGYDLDNNVVLCVQFAYKAKPCNDVYFIGTFTDWELQTAYKFEPIANYPGWYAAEAPANNGVYSGKYTTTEGYPVMADENGDLTALTYQAGDKDAWTYLGYNTADAVDLTSPGASKLVFTGQWPGLYSYRLDYFKNETECTKHMAPTCMYQLILYNNWWGNMLQVDDGYYSERFTLKTGDPCTKTFAIPYFGNNPTITWVEGGGYAGNCSFTVANETGMGIYHQDNCYDLNDRDVVYRFKLSPCAEGENPYNPQNITATLLPDNRLKVSWDKTDGAAQYSVSVRDKDDNYIVCNDYSPTNSVVSYMPLSESGIYVFKVTSLDKDGLQLGTGEGVKKIDLPNVDKATINLMHTPDAGVSNAKGFWIMWGMYNEKLEDWTHKVQMTTKDNKTYTATIEPNAPNYCFYIMDDEDQTASTTRKSYTYNGMTAKELCLEYEYYTSSGTLPVSAAWSCDAVAYHDYRIKSTSTTNNTGSITFAWEADDLSEEYQIDLIGDDDKAFATIFVDEKVNSYTMSVPDEYDGKILKQWVITTDGPFYLPGVSTDGPWTLTKSTVSNTSLTASTKDKKSLDAEWAYSSTDLHYQVEVRFNGVAIKREIVETTKYHYDAIFNGSYEIAVRPTTTGNVVCGTWTVSDVINLDACPEVITGLSGTAGKDNVTFTWTTTAPCVNYAVNFTSVDGTTNIISEGETSKSTITVPASEDGVFTIYLDPMAEVEPGVYQYVGLTGYQAVAPFFTSATHHVEVTATAGGRLYPSDIIGDYGDDYVLGIGIYYTEPDYYFAGWSDGVEDTWRSLVVSSDTAVQAIFEPYVVLTVTSNSDGHVDVSGAEYSDGDNYYFHNGATATLTAVPNTGKVFDEWKDGVKTLSRTFTATENLTLSALFDDDMGKPTYTVDVDSYDYTMGTVNTYGGTYPEGTVLELIATPETGYEFDRWSDDNKDNPRIYTVTNYDYLMAIFKQKMITLSVSATTGGTVTPAGDNTYPYGHILVVKATASDDYHFVNWSDGSVLPERQITMTESMTLTANFVSNSPTAIELPEANAEQVKATKILHNGQIYIIRGDKIYTVQGQVVK